MWILNATVLDENFQLRAADLHISDGRIDCICPHGQYPNATDVVDGTGKIVIPGLVDVHTHGCAGADASDATEGGLEAISRFMGQNGITSFLATTTTLTDDLLVKALEDAVRFHRSPAPGAYIHGINMEGPYLSHPKRGAHRDDWLQTPTAEHFRKMQQAANGLIKIVSVAPEIEGALDFIAQVKDEVRVSIAHTNATYDQAMAGIAAGAKHATHTFNAMTGLAHREPGVIGALADSCVTTELICDCVHVHPAVVRTAFQMFAGRVIMISDSMSATGLSDGEYILGGLDVTVKDGRATLADGTIAGSTTSLMGDVQKAVSIGLPFELVVRSASLAPAMTIGVDHEVGSIALGKSADLVMLDKDLQVEAVWVKGNRIR